MVAIGAIGNDDNGFYSGHVRVYRWDGQSWTKQGQDIDGERASDRSGISVSMSDDGTVVAIGTQQYAGHVCVYEWNANLDMWRQRGADIDGEAEYDSSGRSVSMSNDGTVIAIGAEFNRGSAGDRSGHVRVYKWNGIKWLQRGDDIDGEATEDYSGCSVSMSNDGTKVAIGAYDNDGINGDTTRAGHVRVYEWKSNTWNQHGGDIDGEAANDYSGRSVSISNDGMVVAIGAYGNDASGDASGHVRVYEWSQPPLNWIRRGGDIDGEFSGDNSGISVSLSAEGTVVAIGAPRNSGKGNVRVYKWDTTTRKWLHLGDDIDGEAIGDRFGGAVSMSNDGSVVAIGATLNDGNGKRNSGHVRVMEWTECNPDSCVDSPNRFMVRLNERSIARSCEWIARKNSASRCLLAGVSATCASTCGTCSICADSPLRIKVEKDNRVQTNECVWATGKRGRCLLIGEASCRLTCNKCS